jgi:hypothetical protein
MTHTRLTSTPHRLALLAAVVLGAAGCSSSRTATEAPPLEKRDEIAAALPKGVTLESPVVPDQMYGESSKTVEDALRNLHAYVKNNKLLEGGMGHEIRFESGGAGSPKKAPKKVKGQAPTTVITLAK